MYIRAPGFGALPNLPFSATSIQSAGQQISSVAQNVQNSIGNEATLEANRQAAANQAGQIETATDALLRRLDPTTEQANIRKIRHYSSEMDRVVMALAGVLVVGAVVLIYLKNDD